MTHVIECQDVAFYYGKVPALKDMSFQVQRGEVFALLGPNGAGKTTTIRVLNGLLHPHKGKVSVLGFQPAVEGAAIRQRSGVLTETPALYERLTAWQNLDFFGSLNGLSPLEIAHQANRLLGMFGLQERATDRVDSFSKGMKQRLAFARALLHDPELLFLDEPTSGLDPEAAKHVQDLILEISRQDNRTVVLCTHRLVEAEHLCSRMAIMQKGRVIACGTLEDLRREIQPQMIVNIRTVGPISSDATSQIKKVKGVGGVETSRESAYAVQISGEQVIPSLVSLLVALGVKITAVEPRLPSLEEIYLTLQQDHTQEHL
jgi:ABC-2 type transport system ATP-binding protein